MGIMQIFVKLYTQLRLFLSFACVDEKVMIMAFGVLL